MISLLSITLFCLPSDAAERMTLCTSILVALVFFMLLISKILPSTSLSIPLISKYLMFTFILNLSTVFLSCLSLYLSHHRQAMLTPVPRWMKIVFLQLLPNFLFVNKPFDPEDQNEKRFPAITPSPLLVRRKKVQQMPMPKEMNFFIDEFLKSTDDIKYLSEKIHRETEETKVETSFIIKREKFWFSFLFSLDENTKRIMKIYNEWKSIALVIDRIQLFLFLFVTSIGSISLLCQVPKLLATFRDATSATQRWRKRKTFFSFLILCFDLINKTKSKIDE